MLFTALTGCSDRVEPVLGNEVSSGKEISNTDDSPSAENSSDGNTEQRGKTDLAHLTAPLESLTISTIAEQIGMEE